MKATVLLISIAIIFIFNSCSYEYNCDNTSITPVFIKFQLQDIDTLVIRKYATNTNFTTILDSSIAQSVGFGNYTIHNDSIIVELRSERLQIEPGFDWQIFIPAKNKVVNISAINSPSTTAKCNTGLFSKLGCACFNPIISCKQNNQYFAFNNVNFYAIFINN